MTHVFGFDILPAAAAPRWVAEGLAEYEWDPTELAALRDAVRANAIPRITQRAESGDGSQRLADGFGHAAFDFIESRRGKAGVRQFLVALRQAAANGSDPYQGAFKIGSDEFDTGFERHLKDRFASSAAQLPAERFGGGAVDRIEGQLTAIRFPVAIGLACIEVVVAVEGGTARRWAVACGDGMDQQFIAALKPGDHVIVTGLRGPIAIGQRLLMQSLVRPSDGLTWRAAGA